MSHKPSLVLFVSFTLVCLMIVTIFFHTPVRAQSISTDENNCTTCHEDLYFLHDTGNWFCLRESPMNCVDCHGGNPEAVIQETSHLNRAAHPVINEDVSKCQECHPAECDKRVELFDQMAGIGQVQVAAPYTPAHSVTDHASVNIGVAEQKMPGTSLMLWGTIALVVAGLALATYRIAHRKHN
jgi:hypothetical protein